MNRGKLPEGAKVSLVKKAKPLSTKENAVGMPFGGVSVDIVIPFFGQYDLVRQLVDSIFRNTRNNPYEIFLVDDYSPNLSFGESMAMLPRVKVKRNEKQFGFGTSLFNGFKMGKNPWVLFMNSDCLVENGKWLLELGETMLSLKGQGIKMVSPGMDKITCGDQIVQRDKSELAKDKIVEDFLPLHCVLCHRGLFEKVGGFFKQYPFGFFEDEEFAYRMKAKGFRQAVSGKSWIRHKGGETVKRIWKDNPEAEKIMIEDNRKRCIEDMKKVGR